jgi:hypothetical protein
MARSRKKVPITGITTATSEKSDKVSAHKRERRAVRTRLHDQPAAEILPTTREVSDVWTFAKDGKTYLKPESRTKLLRK